jgi:hypothetical protein
MDKISKFLPKMFRLQQALAQIVNFCLDWQALKTAQISQNDD